MNDSDEYLIEQWRTLGNRSAISDLAVRYLPQFYRTARAMMLTHAQSEDIAQEVMLKVIRCISSFRDASSFRAWSYTILLNTIRNELRREKRASASIDSTQGMLAIVDRQSHPGTSSLQQESKAHVEAAISKLTENQRTALVLMQIDELSAAEVAEMEGCSVDAVYQRLSEAKRKLRNDPSLRSLWLEKN